MTLTPNTDDCSWREIDSLPANQQQIGSYTIVESIEKGMFSEVKLGMNTDSQKEVAVKILEADKTELFITNEVWALEVLGDSHPNIIKIIEHGKLQEHDHDEHIEEVEEHKEELLLEVRHQADND